MKALKMVSEQKNAYTIIKPGYKHYKQYIKTQKKNQCLDIHIIFLKKDENEIL